MLRSPFPSCVQRNALSHGNPPAIEFVWRICRPSPPLAPFWKARHSLKHTSGKMKGLSVRRHLCISALLKTESQGRGENRNVSVTYKQPPTNFEQKD